MHVVQTVQHRTVWIQIDSKIFMPTNQSTLIKIMLKIRTVYMHARMFNSAALHPLAFFSFFRLTLYRTVKIMDCDSLNKKMNRAVYVERPREDVTDSSCYDDDASDSEATENRSLKCPQSHSVAGHYDPKIAGKKRLRKYAKRRNKKMKSELVLNNKAIKASLGVCERCNCQSKCCKFVSFGTIKMLREEIYGEGCSQDSIRKWRFLEVKRMLEKTRIQKTKEGTNMDKNLMDYWIPGRFMPSGQDLPVCRRCWQEVTSVCAESLDNIKRKIVEGVMADTSSVGGHRPKEDSSEKLHVHAWIECFIQSLTCYSPDEKKHELPGNLTLSAMHEAFKKDWEDGVMNGSYSRSNYGRMAVEKRSERTPPGYSFFCKVWKKEFGNDFKIPRHHKRFPQCNWCARLKGNIAMAKTHEERIFWKQEQFAHYLWVTTNRKVYYRHREKARADPSK